jgi:Co/Zn/Cd efflux system component
VNTRTHPWQHEHDFHQHHEAAERGTRALIWIALAAMAREITAGGWLGSMALLADGWPMAGAGVPTPSPLG